MLSHARNAGAPVRANMVGWYRRGQGITQVSNNVSAWADQSGSGNNLVQATGAARPTLQGTGTVLFNGTSHFMATGNFTLVQPCSIYMRVKQVSWTAGRYFCDGTTVNRMVIQQVSVTPQICLFAGAAAASNSGLPVGSFGSVGAVFNAASSVLQTPGATTTGNPTNPGGPGGVTIGGSASGTALGNVEVAEVIVYSVGHDSATMQRVINYLNGVI